MKISFRAMEEADVAPLLAFSTQMFGAGEHQSRGDYIDWLYRENPHARGLGDAILAVADGGIVGVVHRMVLPCVGPDGPNTLLSLQNHVVTPDLRGGAGIMLLRHASHNALTFSPGVHGRLTEVYRRLGYLELPSFWMTKVLRPIRGGAQYALHRVGLAGAAKTPGVDLAKVQRAVRGHALVSASPGAETLAGLADAMNAQGEAAGGWRVAWTADSLRWRFFSPQGPRHILVKGDADWAILSIGQRGGLTISRLIERGGEDPRFMKTVFAAAGAMGASVAMTFSTLRAFRDLHLAQGWRMRDDPPTSFASGAQMISASAAAGDFGFESFGVEIRG